MEENKRSSKSLMDSTANSSVYNKARKIYLEQSGKIKCSICGYHRGENDKRKYFGTVKFWKKDNPNVKVRFPSWKLATKNRKQWMGKPITYQIIPKNSEFWGDYVDVKF